MTGRTPSALHFGADYSKADFALKPVENHSILTAYFDGAAEKKTATIKKCRNLIAAM